MAKSPKGKAWLRSYRKERYRTLNLYPAWKERYYSNPAYREKARKATRKWRLKKKFEREHSIVKRCEICGLVTTPRRKYCYTCRKLMYKYQAPESVIKKLSQNKK